MLTIRTDSHLHGETIVEHGFPHEYESLLAVLGGIDIPLRPAGPFTTSGRPMTPKRQFKKIGGKSGYALFPIDQKTLNTDLDKALRADGWTEQPIAAGKSTGTLPEVGLKGDFVRNGVFVEVEFGNAASLYRDLFKFQVASRSGVGEVGVLVVATGQMARFFDSGTATFEQALSLLPYLKIGIQMPIMVVGLEPRDWKGIQDRYQEMEGVAVSNDVTCHSFATVSGALSEAGRAAFEFDEETPPE